MVYGVNFWALWNFSLLNDRAWWGKHLEFASLQLAVRLCYNRKREGRRKGGSKTEKKAKLRSRNRRIRGLRKKRNAREQGGKRKKWRMREKEKKGGERGRG